MRVPPVTDRLKEAPAQALRAVFSGVGQVLLVADRLRHRQDQEEANGHAASPAKDGETAAAAETGAAAGARGAAETGAADGTGDAGGLSGNAEAAAADGTGDVSGLGRNAEAGAADGTGGAAAADGVSEAGAGAGADAAGGTGGPLRATASAAGGGLPLEGYDGLTVPQLRARMRTLDAAQLRALIEHERANAGRDDVVAMFERRIAKVEGGE